MQPNIDMGLIREAMARRGMGGLGGGAPTPAVGQLTSGGPSPMGGPSTQQPAMPQQPTPGLAQVPTQVSQTAAPQNGALKAGQQAQGPQFDDETRTLAKSLVQRLLKAI
jgi:hypothetical protein